MDGDARKASQSVWTFSSVNPWVFFSLPAPYCRPNSGFFVMYSAVDSFALPYFLGRATKSIAPCLLTAGYHFSYYLSGCQSARFLRGETKHAGRRRRWKPNERDVNFLESAQTRLCFSSRGWTSEWCHVPDLTRLKCDDCDQRKVVNPLPGGCFRIDVNPPFFPLKSAHYLMLVAHLSPAAAAQPRFLFMPNQPNCKSEHTISVPQNPLVVCC